MLLTCSLSFYTLAVVVVVIGFCLSLSLVAVVWGLL